MAANWPVHVRRYLNHTPRHGNPARGREIIKQRKKYCEDERAHKHGDRSRRPAQRTSLNFEKNHSQPNKVEAQDDQHGEAPSFVNARRHLQAVDWRALCKIGAKTSFT
jgi:hypothetical protein